MNSANISWEAVSAISSVVQTFILLISGMGILIQLKQFRQESVQSRITALDTATETLKTKEFIEISNAIKQNNQVLEAATWNGLFDSLDRVSLLIEENYTDKSLFFSINGREIAAIGKYLTQNQIPEESRRLFNSPKYSAVRNLLRQTIHFVERADTESTDGSLYPL